MLVEILFVTLPLSMQVSFNTSEVLGFFSLIKMLHQFEGVQDHLVSLHFFRGSLWTIGFFGLGGFRIVSRHVMILQYCLGFFARLHFHAFY